MQNRFEHFKEKDNGVRLPRQDQVVSSMVFHKFQSPTTSSFVHHGDNKLNTLKSLIATAKLQNDVPEKRVPRMYQFKPLVEKKNAKDDEILVNIETFLDYLLKKTLKEQKVREENDEDEVDYEDFSDQSSRQGRQDSAFETVQLPQRIPVPKPTPPTLTPLPQKIPPKNVPNSFLANNFAQFMKFNALGEENKPPQTQQPFQNQHQFNVEDFYKPENFKGKDNPKLGMAFKDVPRVTTTTQRPSSPPSPPRFPSFTPPNLPQKPSFPQVALLSRDEKLALLRELLLSL